MRKIFVSIGLILCCTFGAQAQVSVALAPVPAQQFFSQAGAPLASGCVNTYITGTSTPLATYTDGTGTAQNTNPIILDAGGFGNIWLTNSSYRFTIYSTGGVNCATGTLQRTVDGVSAYTILNQAQVINLLGASSDPAGSAGQMAYRSDIPCFRGFTTLWDCFVTLTATQTLANKTLTSPTINTPIVSGLILPLVSTDPSGSNGQVTWRTDLLRARLFGNPTNLWDSITTDLVSTSLSNKTLVGPVINGGGNGGTNLLISPTAPTINSGFGTSPSIIQNGTAAFTVTVGSAPGNGGVITVPSGNIGNTGWNCIVNNQTAALGNRADNTRQTNSTTIAITVQNQTTSTGAALNFTAADKITFNCAEY